MIEMKAIANNEKGTTEVSCHIEGTGADLANEAVSIIESMMGDLKKQSIIIHFVILKALADNPEILIGGDNDEHDKFAKIMAKLTSKSVIGKGELN